MTFAIGLPSYFYLLRLANKPMHPTVQKLLAYFGIDSAGDGQRSKDRDERAAIALGRSRRF